MPDSARSVHRSNAVGHWSKRMDHLFGSDHEPEDVPARAARPAAIGADRLVYGGRRGVLPRVRGKHVEAGLAANEKRGSENTGNPAV